MSRPPAAGYDGFLSYSRSASEPLAQALERGLEAIARPWYRVGGMRIFRDRTGLGATADLRNLLFEHVRASRFLVLLASEAAAKSPWVEDELRQWFETLGRSADKTVVVLTDGTMPSWQRDQNRLDPATTLSLPPAFIKHCASEPAFVDLRWVDRSNPPSLWDGRFLDAVADIATPLLGKNSKDEVVSDERRRRKIVRSVVAGTLTLGVCLGIAIYFLAERQQRIDRSEVLAAQSSQTLEDNPDQALLLATAANAAYPTDNAKRALLQSVFRARGLVGVARGRRAALQTLQFIGPGELVSADAKGEVRRWRVDAATSSVKADGQPVSFHEDFKDGSPTPDRVETNSVISPDGRWLFVVNAAIVNEDDTPFAVRARLANLSGAAMLPEHPDLEEAFGIPQPYAVAASEDGRLLTLIGSLGNVRQWAVDKAGIASASTIEPCGHRFGPVGLSADGSTATCSGDGATTIAWDIVRAEQLADIPEGGLGQVSRVALSDNGAVAAIADNTFGLRIIAVRPSQTVGQTSTTLNSEITALGFDRRADRLAVATADGQLQIYQLSDGAFIKNESFNIGAIRATSVAFNPDGSLLAAGRDDGSAMVWRTDHEFSLARDLGNGSPAVAAAALSHDERMAAVVSSDDSSGTVQIYDVDTGKAVGDPIPFDRRLIGASFGASANLLQVFGVRGQDGECPSTGSPELLVVTDIDLNDRRSADRTSKATRCSIGQVHVAPGGLVVASEDGIAVWRDGSEPEWTDIWHVQSHFFGNYDFTASDDGGRIAFRPLSPSSPSAAPNIEVWQLTERLPARLASVPISALLPLVALSGDGNILSEGDAAGPVNLWKVGTDQQSTIAVKPLDVGPEAESVVIDTSAKYLAVARQDGEIELWDIERQRLVGTVPAMPRQMPISGLAFSGEHLVARYSEGDVRVFDMRPQSWTRLACQLTIGVRQSGEAAGLSADELAALCPG